MEARTVVVFDLDGTLTKRDTYLPFLFGYLALNPLRTLRLLMLPIPIIRFMVGNISNGKLKQCFLSAILKGVRKEDVELWAQRYAKKLVRTGLREKAIQRIKQHREKGHFICILSASLDIYVPCLGRELEVDEVICTQVEYSSDRKLTGRLATPNCYGEEKVRRLEGWLNQFNERPEVIGYGDHHSDIAVLELADRGVLICKDPDYEQSEESSSIEKEYWRL